MTNNLEIYRKLKLSNSKFKMGGYIIGLIDTPCIEDKLLKLMIEATNPKGREVFIDNPVYIKNPPIYLRKDKKTIKRNPEEALKEIIYSHIVDIK